MQTIAQKFQNFFLNPNRMREIGQSFLMRKIDLRNTFFFLWGQESIIAYHVMSWSCLPGDAKGDDVARDGTHIFFAKMKGGKQFLFILLYLIEFHEKNSALQKCKMLFCRCLRQSHKKKKVNGKITKKL